MTTKQSKLAKSLPAYRHVVIAAQIRAIRFCEAPNRGAELVFAEPYESVNVPGSWVDKHQPHVGGYYTSAMGGEPLGTYVPRLEFESQYEMVAETPHRQE